MSSLPRFGRHAGLTRLIASRRNLMAAVGSLLVAVSLAACKGGEPGFHATDVTGGDLARNGFTLTGHDGKPHSLAAEKGKAVVVFFGFTHCPDVCPTTMVELAEVMKLLGPKADRVQVFFVSVDPERDTRELLAQYVPAFDPRFVGLTGTPEEIAAMAKDFRVFYQKSAVTGSDNYSVDHTAGTYVFDPQGRLRLFARYGAGAQPMADDIGRLLDGA